MGESEEVLEAQGKAGRPAGSIETSFVLLKRDLKETLALNKKARGILLKQMEELEK